MGKIDFAVNEEGNRVGICSDKLNRPFHPGVPVGL